MATRTIPPPPPPLFSHSGKEIEKDEKESKFFFYPGQSLKYRRIIVDESALAPIAGRKLTFDKLV